LTQGQALASGFANFDASVQTAVLDWLSKAQRILSTSEDIDHIGGLVALVPAQAKLPARSRRMMADEGDRPATPAWPRRWPRRLSRFPYRCQRPK